MYIRSPGTGGQLIMDVVMDITVEPLFELSYLCL